MSLLSNIPDFTSNLEDAIDTSSCIQHAQEQKSLCQSLLILGVSSPVIIWPLLPSTYEVLRYRILALSSLAQLILALLWSACALTTDVDDALWPSFQRTLSAFILSHFCCYITVGIIGHGADKSGKRLGRESFDVPAYITVGMLLVVTPLHREYLFNRSSKHFTTVGLILMGTRMEAWH